MNFTPSCRWFESLAFALLVNKTTTCVNDARAKQKGKPEAATVWNINF